MSIEYKNKLIKEYGYEFQFDDIESANQFLIAFDVIEPLDLSRSRLDVALGYEYIFAPTHPLANASGKLYTHRYIAALKYGKYPRSDEDVHHLDENKINNNPENIILLSRMEHSSLHMKGKYAHFYSGECSNCGGKIHYKRKYCSPICYNKCRGIKLNTNPLMEKDLNTIKLMLWQMPKTKIVELLDISKYNLEEFIEFYEIDTPPSGYWTKNENRLTPYSTINRPSEFIHLRKFNPSKEELESLIWKMPTTEVAALFGVSDKAIEKRCKKMDIQKPPRGYWAKLKANKM